MAHRQQDFGLRGMLTFYRGLILLYPRDFRGEYADQMMRDFADLACVTHDDGRSLFLLLIRTFFDTVRTATREHRTVRTRHMQHASRTNDYRKAEFMGTTLQDLRYALRTLTKHPAFTAAAAVTLALGIGANTAIFSVVNSVLLQPLPYHDDQRLVLLEQHRPGTQNTGFSVQELVDYRSQSETLEEVVEYHSLNFVLLGRGDPERVQSGVVSWQFFQTLGVQPVLGRVFGADDDLLGAEPVLVLSHRYWQSSYGGDSTVVGQTVRMNDKVHTIVGVLPPVPHYPRENDVYMPSVACPFRSGPGWIDNRSVRGLTVFTRVKSGVSDQQVETEVASLAHRMRQEHPEHYPEEGVDHRVDTVRLKEQLVRNARPTLLILMGTVGLVLLIASANVASLTLARLSRREREMAMRTALGAGRRRLARQLITESMLLALVGGALGVMFAAGGLDLLVTFTARFTRRAREIDIDGSVLAFTLVVSVVTGLIFGSMPALPSRRNPADALRESGARATASTGKLRLRSALVVSQIAISFMLLIGAGLAIRSFTKLQAVDAGIRAENVLTGTIAVPFNAQIEPVQFIETLLDDIESQPGVLSAAVTTSFPLSEVAPFSNAFEIEGRPVADTTLRPVADFRRISPKYFDTINQPLLRGRTFTRTDGGEGSQPVIIVNQSFGRNHFGDDDPIGKRVLSSTFGSQQDWFTIVGVVGDVRQSLDTDIADEVYFPFRQFPFSFNRLLVRSAGDPWMLVGPIQDAIHALQPEVPLADIRSLAQVRTESLASPRLTALLLGLFAALALVISATGIAGVIGFSVSQRTNEIGVRMALGARQSSVLWLVLRQGMTLVGIGLALGLVGSFALTRLMTGLLFGVGATDPLTFVGVAGALAAVAATATLIPAGKATAIDPMVALRSE
jgi:putative ABC transport system permease protein